MARTRIDDFSAAAVVQGQHQRHAVVVLGFLERDVHFLKHGLGQMFEAADLGEADVVLHHRGAFGAEVIDVHLHEEGDFGGGAFPVFEAEGIEGEEVGTAVFFAEAGAFGDDSADGFRAFAGARGRVLSHV